MRLTGVGHRYGAGPWLFTGLDVCFEPGRVYAVTGPSGSGKSTLLAILAGWLKPAAGTVDRPAGFRTGWVSQNPHGVARRTVADHVAFPVVARGATRAEADGQAATLLELFALSGEADHPYATLSGGQAQRLMLARALAARPGLLLVDEPTAQLDRATAATVDAVIGRLAAPGVIALVATHDPGTQAACTDHLDLADFAP